MILLGGAIWLLVFSSNFLRPLVRRIEILVPDHDEVAGESQP